MQFKFFSLLSLSFAATAFGQAVPDLVTLLGDTSELSGLLSLVSTFPEIVSALGAAENITVFAPDNRAFETFTKMYEARNITRESVAALLSYHVLNGSFPSTVLSKTPVFAPTYLGAFGEYPDFKNLTQGDSQVVKAVIEADKPYVYGGIGMRVSISDTVSC